MVKPLSDAQRTYVLAWVEARLTPWDEVWTHQDKLKHIGITLGTPELRAVAETMRLSVVGSNGGRSWKPNPSYKDIDLAYVLPSTLDIETLGFFTAVTRDRARPLADQTIRCTIPDIAVQRLDFLSPMREFEGHFWACPSACQHCRKPFYDGKLRIVDGKITHISCI